MHPSIAYHTRPGVIEARVDNVIEFSDSHYLALEYAGQFDNGYDFLKECLTTLGIL